MLNTFEQDLHYLENKYHDTEKEFNPFKRWDYHGYEYDETTGLDDKAMLDGLENLYNSMEGMPHPVIKASAFDYVLKNTRIDINEHDWFIGFYSWNRVISKTITSKWNNDTFKNVIPGIGERMNKHNRIGTLMMWPDYDHCVPDWDALFELGFPGILQRARTYRKEREEIGKLTEEQESYFDSIDIEYSAIIGFLGRLIEYGKMQLITNKKATSVVKCLESLKNSRPANTYEVLQFIYIYFMISEYVDCLQVRSLGNLDRVLYPYYKKDIENGTFTEQQIRELFKYFLIQFSAIGNYWGQPFYFGGTAENGESIINELSYLILDVYDELGIYNPKLQIKLAPNTPERFVYKALDMVRGGHNSIVFVCEPAITRAMMQNGNSMEEARTCDIKGCYEYSPRATSVGTGGLHVNMVKPVELVLNNGIDPLTGEMIGCETGDCKSFKTFDEFYKAYLKQLEYIYEDGISIVNEVENHFLYINPTPMFSGTIRHSLEIAQDAYAGGAIYNSTGVLLCCSASAADCLMGIKKFVYDLKEISLIDLKKALANDWKGYEELQQKIKLDKDKYGNNLEIPDLYTRSITSYIAGINNMRPNAVKRGGVYTTSLHCARMFLNFAPITGATPDGRKRGDELSKNMSPSVGADWAGATGLINSITKLDSAMFLGDFPIDINLHPSAVAGEDGLIAMKALLYTYMNRGGHAIHFNVTDACILKDAQKNPVKYKNLQVRVCGWNVLFNNLSKDEQDAYIKRAEIYG